MIRLSDELLASSIKRGAILHSHMFRYIGHGKFFLVVGVSEEKMAGFFFINSQINDYILRNNRLLNAQVMIRKDDYNFLSHDSFISAIRFTEIKVDEIVDSINRNETKFIEDIKEDDLEKVLEIVRTSNLFNDDKIEQYAK